VFCISKDVAGPATLGFFEPVVLLPASFLSLDEDAQRSVACHELMHVRRNDWLVTLLEEVAGSLLWFHPLVWFLLAKTRLTREQVVDAEVVRMNAPGPYIDALLSMAVVSKPRLALPAAPFFTEGHLTYRMRLLLASPRRSLTRLCISYACTAGVLAFAGWSVLILFPLNGDAHVVSAAAHRLPTYQVASSGRRLLLPASSTFNLKLPAPAGETKDLVYFVNTEGQQAVAVQGYLMPPPPPPPPPPGPPAVFRTGLRVLRPGQAATPEEIQNFIASFPQQTLVQVIKGEDGTIQRVMVTRRSADATIFTPFGVGVLGGIDGPATAAGTTDRVH
jgi:hypothetical protein